MAMKNNSKFPISNSQKKRGFALLISIIFMSVMLAFGLTLGALGYKQEVLASSAIESQYAFYAADAGLECALYYDQQLNTFAYQSPQPSSAPRMLCDGTSAFYPPAYPTGIVSYSGSQWVLAERVSLDGDKRCADVTIYKPAPGSGTTYIFSQGYDVSCATVASPGGARFVARGLKTRY